MTEEEEKVQASACDDAKVALRLTDKYLQRMEGQVCTILFATTEDVDIGLNWIDTTVAWQYEWRDKGNKRGIAYLLKQRQEV